MTNSGDGFARLSELFDEIVRHDPATWDAAVDERCGGDEELARELRSLLKADGSGEPDTFLGDVVSAEADAIGPADATGRTLGSWRIVRPLAEGGMGTVYVAERADGAYEARAAVKLVRGGIPSAALDARLREERQILASLSHPGIARLLDGGSTEDGTPYLVMELIGGVPITEWCEREGLDVEARLRLFAKVCDAVSYAHGALVAHRDIKPSNILVTPEGEPKLLDFGIAKIIDALDESAEDQTRSASLMTPAYASPEQVSGRRAGVATDVYALGALLYELLTARLPLATRGLSPIELEKVVLGEVPPLPSSVADPTDRRRALRGDLDAVVSRALRKEPEQRYATVAELAEDVRRHLDGLPVRVRHDDWTYRSGKFVRRNAGAVSGAVFLAVTLLSFTVSSFLQARAIAAERDRAERQRESAVRVSSFLEELLSEADPNQAAGRDVTAREVLDRGASRVLDQLEVEPAIQATLATVMGRVYRNLGEYDAAVPLLDSALAVRRRGPGTDPADLADGLVERGALAYDLGEYEDALVLHGEAVERYRAAFDGDDQRIADALNWISSSLGELERLDEAEEAGRESVAMNRRLHPNEADADLAIALIGLADVLRSQGTYGEARELGEEGLAMLREVHGDVHLDVAWALNQLASTLSRGGEAELAVPLVEEGLAVRREIFEGPHVEVAASLGNLANVLDNVGRIDEALVARRESGEMVREIFGDDHPYVAATTLSLGQLLLGAGRVDEALPVLEEAVTLHRTVLPPGDPNLGNALSTLGRALDRQGRPTEAEPYLREALQVFEGAFGADDERTDRARDALREHYLARGMTEAATALGG